MIVYGKKRRDYCRFHSVMQGLTEMGTGQNEDWGSCDCFYEEGGSQGRGSGDPFVWEELETLTETWSKTLNTSSYTFSNKCNETQPHR